MEEIAVPIGKGVESGEGSKNKKEGTGDLRTQAIILLTLRTSSPP
jgi:hypothetical protein